MTATEPLVILLDVDDTLLDNDRFAADLSDELERRFGAAERERYWAIYNELRQELGYADYLASLQRFRVGLENHPALLEMSAFVLDYPFEQRLFPGVMETLAHLRTLGRPVILSDGDVVFQPRKVHRAGLWDALHGDVLIYLHKQQMLDGMQQRYPAAHYVMVDDKPQILADMKRLMGARLTTAWVKQGHYAAAAAGLSIDPAPDLEIACIAELRGRKLGDFLQA
ncbi:HAD family hydrolase [Rhodanobacter sp. DHB23]|uniref:HAD family hydrolase n=1 Tax=Rhodanobacter sp. DHB23 TaxID=2775923 RepID=UPI001782DB87|nr:HAD family hydrolase [Rhodanobacter sp. DHB23]